MSGPYPVSWDDLCDPSLPEHTGEVLSAHQGAPSIEVQDRTHGAGLPAVDHGTDDRRKVR